MTHFALIVADATTVRIVRSRDNRVIWVGRDEAVARRVLASYEALTAAKAE